MAEIAKKAAAIEGADFVALDPGWWRPERSKQIY